MDSFQHFIDSAGRAVDAVGVAAVIIGTLLAALFAATRLLRREGEVYRKFRQFLGRSILLGLELLRRGAFLDARFGWHVLRGMAAAGVALGAGSLALAASPLLPFPASSAPLAVTSPFAGTLLVAWAASVGTLLALAVGVPLLARPHPPGVARGIRIVVACLLLGGMARMIDGISLDGDLVVTVGVALAAAWLLATTDVLAGIQDGSILFTVDQQQYLQGYLPIAMLVLYHDNGNTLGGGHPVLTGPAFVDAENVDQVAEFVEAGTR